VPLAGYRFEPIVVALVALAALPVIALAGPQDRTRYELTRHLVLQRTLTVEPSLFDRAVYRGRSYSDKAPGMSFLAVPAYTLERAAGIAKPPRDWSSEGDLSLWLLRVLSSGVMFLAAVVLVGRLAERLVAGAGAATAAIFGVATMAAPLAPTFFEHDAAAACAIAAFAALSFRRGRGALLLSGLLAGSAVLFQYAAGLVALALAIYVVARHGRRVGWFLLGGVPPAIALGAYDWVAFGSPLHLSYRYVANPFAEQQHHGFFGIGLPTLDGLRQVLVGPRGLLVFSPVVLAAVVGLVLLWRRGDRAQALVAAALSLVFVLVAAGYFLPYGGQSPGPRFVGPALPFLALGLPCALARFPRPTFALAFASAALTSVDSMTWGVRRFDDSSWVPSRNDIAKTAWAWIVPNRNVGAILVLGFSLAAIGTGAAAWSRR
jgi:hypothetical protein